MTPSTIGPFEIKFELYNDGVKTVYVASHPQYGEVAVKLLPRGFWDDLSFRLRFEREISIVASLNHFAIVPVYELGEQDGQAYQAMKFISGENLADRLKRGPLPFRDAVYIIGQLAQALDAVHEKGVLHRNIKPENVLFDEQGEPYLSDLALVKIVPANAYASLTHIDGAPAYMSPEQALGQTLDACSDVYALGALLFHMLTGRQPFEAVSPVEQAVQGVTLPTPAVRKLRPSLPPGCEEVIAKAMAKDPADRYHNTYDLAADMALLVENARALPVSQQMAGSSGCGKVIGVALALILVALIGLGIGFATRVLDFATVRDAVSQLLIPPAATSLSTSTLPPSTATQFPEDTLAATPTFGGLVKPSATVDQSTPLEDEATPTRQATSAVTSTNASTPTPSPSPIVEVLPTHTATAIPLIIGGADLIAFLNANDIWTANLDGSELDRLTQDKVAKTDLQWTPDGKALTYNSEGCYYILRMDTRATEKIGCFADFEISPDMSMVVIGDKVLLSNENMRWLNFYMSYNLTSLKQLGDVPQSPILGGCPFYGGRHTRFSVDGALMAAVFDSPQGGRNVDMVQVYNANVCNTTLDPLDGFPGIRFTMKGFSGLSDTPVLTDFGWDGEYLFALHGDILNGYGEMVIYNMSLGRADIHTPIDGQCCYQDIQWSPDNQYLVFVFQDVRLGTGAQIYYIPYGALGTGATYTPIEMPFYFFADPKARVEPALRPAKP